MNLDIGTLTIVFCLICLLQIFVLTVHFLLNKTHQVKAWWSLGVGLGLVMLGFLATFVGPFLSGKISQVANHLLFVFGQAFLYLGVMSFFERRPNRLWLAFFLAAFTILEIYFTTVPNNLAARRAILYLSHAGFLFLSGRVVYKYRTPSIQTTALFLAGAFFIYAVIFVFCTLFTLAYPPAAALLEPPPAQITTLLGGIIASTIYTFGFIFMLNQRSTYEMNHFKQHYELLFRTNPDAVMISRLSDGRIIEVNEGFTTQLGYTRPEIIANTISNLHFWHDISERQVMIKALTENGYCENLETIFQCKDGRLINVLVFARLVELDGIPHVIGVFHDVTHLKQVEAVMGARNRLLLLANSG